MNLPQVSSDGRHDFDFVFGRWRLHNRRLANVLDPDCAHWVQFEATGQAYSILGGLGNIDLFSAVGGPPNGRPLEAITLVDLDTLTAELLAVMDETMQPTRASLWLRSPRQPPRRPYVPSLAITAVETERRAARDSNPQPPDP